MSASAGHGRPCCWISIWHRLAFYAFADYVFELTPLLLHPVKVRFQNPQIAQKYHSTLHAITTIIREERFSGLYKGISSPLVSHVLRRCSRRHRGNNVGSMLANLHLLIPTGHSCSYEWSRLCLLPIFHEDPAWSKWLYPNTSPNSSCWGR